MATRPATLQPRICRAPACTGAVFENGRCKLHYIRQCEREDYEAAQADKVAVRNKLVVTCTARGCTRPSICRRLCQSHYTRWKRNEPINSPIRDWGKPRQQQQEPTP